MKSSGCRDCCDPGEPGELDVTDGTVRAASAAGCAAPLGPNPKVVFVFCFWLVVFGYVVVVGSAVPSKLAQVFFSSVNLVGIAAESSYIVVGKL